MAKENKLETNQYKCPSCGAIVEFDPKSQKLKCPYCFTTTEISKNTNVSEQNIDKLLSNTTVWKNAEVIQCANCGAQEIIKDGEFSTNCAFCGANNIVKTTEIVGMTPHGICPFEKSSKDIVSNVKTWVKGRHFAPNAFKKNATICELKGVYSPAFTFDCNTSSKYDGKLGERRTRSVSDGKGGTKTESYTDYFYISGTHAQKFDDLIIHTSKDIPTQYLQELEPFPTTTCAHYDPKFLTGYSANTYAKDGKQTWEDFKVRSTNQIKQGILKKYKHDEVAYLNTETTYSNTSFKYLLLPVYVGHHKYKNKNYNFYINGCTGKVAGKAPVSGWKIFFLILGIIGIVGLPILISLLIK